MLGFWATAKTTDIQVDNHELEDAKWFDRKKWLRAHRDEDDNFRLPRPDSDLPAA